MNHFNIAVDGPAGAGKSTIAKLVAKELGFVYVDTGAMYRAMALYFLRKGVDPKAAEEIGRSCPEVDVTIRYQEGVQQVLLNGEDVSGLIRTEEVGNMASAVSGYMPVREKLVELQKQLAAKENVIMDGRDIGTCVLPDAPAKIYLTASVEVRAVRRYKELGGEIITTGSDSHNAVRIAANFQPAMQMSQRAGFDYICSFDKMKPVFHKF